MVLINGASRIGWEIEVCIWRGRRISLPWRSAAEWRRREGSRNTKFISLVLGNF